MHAPDKTKCAFYTTENWIARNFYRTPDGFLPTGGCLLQNRPKRRDESPCTGCKDYQPGHLLKRNRVLMSDLQAPLATKTSL